MSEPKHISENPCKREQNSNLFEVMPSAAGFALNEMSKVLQQLPCIQLLLKSPSFGGVGEASLSGWLDSQNVMQALHISPRTLQTLRTNGTLPFSRIGNKIYYRRQDIEKILSDNYTMYNIRNHGNKQ
jgi:hypothetical protein